MTANDRGRPGKDGPEVSATTRTTIQPTPPRPWDLDRLLDVALWVLTALLVLVLIALHVVAVMGR